MKSFLYTAVAASALLGHASSFASATVNTGQSAIDNGVRVALLGGSNSWVMQRHALSFFNDALYPAGKDSVTAIAPASLQTASRYGQLLVMTNLNAPVSALTFSAQTNGSAHIESLRSSGGIQFVALGNEYSSSGGSLQITNLRVDTTTQSVYADLTGGNGASAVIGMHLFNYGSVYGSLDLPRHSATSQELIFSGLSLTQSSADYFSSRWES
jgi:hypothetical protein